MGLFEIIGELISPGPIGSMDFNDNRDDERQKFIPFRFVISLLMIGLVEYYFVYKNELPFDFVRLIRVNTFLIIYLLMASVIRIKPDYDNLGWVPFIFNNPFRFSDNINRFLVILNVLFMPGKYISKSIAGFYRYCKRRRDNYKKHGTINFNV
jgi:hypothetical protein